MWGETQSNSQPGVFGKCPVLAGRFVGDVEVSGDIRLVGGQDCAKQFDVLSREAVEPGAVMVIAQNGCLAISQEAYDKKVAGVVSGAGSYRPAIILDRKEASNPARANCADGESILQS